MYIIVIEGRDRGAYSIKLSNGIMVLQIFEDINHAERYAYLLESEGFPKLEIIEIVYEQVVNICKKFGYYYTIIKLNDFVIPPLKNYDFI